jgi:ppGpp synthetase/RelA/SpoT-type nucleotidyltranferase
VLPSSNRAIAAAGQRFRDEQEVPADRDLLLGYRQFLSDDLAETFEGIRERTAGIPGLLSCRIKRLDSTVRKLRREHAMDLVRMDDIVGFRLIVPSPASQAAALTALAGHSSVRRVKDYREDPRLGYRAVHVISRRALQLPGAQQASMYPHELQLRTYHQHLWASTSESFGEQVKEGGGPADARAYLDALADSIRADEEDSPDQPQMEEIRQKSGLVLYTLQFDRRSREIEQLHEFGQDLGKAMRYFGYLEEQASDDLRREVVLLGCSSGINELRVTHLRYFQPRGIPDLPDRLRPKQDRPG